jgi:hypothetical protein
MAKFTDEERAMYERLRAVASQCKIPIITAKQHPPLAGTRKAEPPLNDIIIIDYLDIIRA